MAIAGSIAIVLTSGADAGPRPVWRWLAIAGGAVAVSDVVFAVQHREVARLRLALALLAMTAFPRAAHGSLGPVAATAQGLLLFLVAHTAFTACEHPDLPASYAGGEPARRPWIAIAALAAGSLAADVVLFALLDATRETRTDAVLLAVLGTLCTAAIAGVVAVLALRTPPVR